MSRTKKDLLQWSSDDLKKLTRALHFAAQKHSRQRRKDADRTPYINHPISLLNILVNIGEIEDIEVLCAAVLHDTVEDTETSFRELEENFGAEIASIVREVTDDKSLPKEIRKELQVQRSKTKSEKAKLVSLADKISNLRDILDHPPKNWPIERIQKYYLWAARVVQQMVGTNQKLEKEFQRVLELCKKKYPPAEQ